MKKTNLIICFESEKLDALQFYIAKKDVDLQKELCDTVQKLYEKHVPQATREYIEDRLIKETKPIRSTKSNSSRPTSAPQPTSTTDS